MGTNNHEVYFGVKFVAFINTTQQFIQLFCVLAIAMSHGKFTG